MVKKRPVFQQFSERLLHCISVRLRNMGSSSPSRVSLGFTVPIVICKDLSLELGDIIEVIILRKKNA